MTEAKDPDYFYLHKNGQTIRKPAIVVERGGGPHEYFDSPFVVRWWQGEDKKR